MVAQMENNTERIRFHQGRADQGAHRLNENDSVFGREHLLEELWKLSID
jgi:hypothetical protein